MSGRCSHNCPGRVAAAVRSSCARALCLHRPPCMQLLACGAAPALPSFDPGERPACTASPVLTSCTHGRPPCLEKRFLHLSVLFKVAYELFFFGQDRYSGMGGARQVSEEGEAAALPGGGLDAELARAGGARARGRRPGGRAAAGAAPRAPSARPALSAACRASFPFSRH